MTRSHNQTSSKEGSCLAKHYFICQADAFSDQDANYERNGNNSHSCGKPKRTKREVIRPRSKVTSGDTRLSTMRHQPAEASMSKTLCHRLSPFPSLPPEVTPQGVSVTPAPTSQPLPLTPGLPRPGSVTRAGKALVEITSSPKEDSHPGVFTSHPQVSLQNASDQVSVEN